MVPEPIRFMQLGFRSPDLRYRISSQYSLPSSTYAFRYVGNTTAMAQLMHSSRHVTKSQNQIFRGFEGTHGSRSRDGQ